MPGSPTTPGRPGARNSAPVRVAFHVSNRVGIRDSSLSRLNGWPVRTPVNASRQPSRVAAHDSGPLWLAMPYSAADLHHLLLAGFTGALEKLRFQRSWGNFRP